VILPEKDYMQTWWVPFGPSQFMACSIAYALLAALLLVCLVVAARAFRRQPGLPSVAARGDCAEVAASASAFGAGADTGGDSIEEASGIDTMGGGASLDLGMGALLVLHFLRCAGLTAISSTMVSTPAVGTLLELLLVMVTLEDGQGLWSFLLFGLQSHLLLVFRRRLSCSRLAPSPRSDEEDAPVQRAMSVYVLSLPRSRADGMRESRLSSGSDVAVAPPPSLS